MRCSDVRSKRGPHLLLVSSIGMTTPGHGLDRYRRLQVIYPVSKKICFNVRRPVTVTPKKGKLYDKAELEAPDEEACRRYSRTSAGQGGSGLGYQHRHTDSW